MAVDCQDRAELARDVESLVLLDVGHQFPEDPRLLGKDGVDGGQHELHQFAIAVERFDDVEQGFHVALRLLPEEFLLAFFVAVVELDEEVGGAGLEDFVVALEVVEAELGPVGHLVQRLLLLVEAERVIMELLFVSLHPQQVRYRNINNNLYHV